MIFCQVDSKFFQKSDSSVTMIESSKNTHWIKDFTFTFYYNRYEVEKDVMRLAGDIEWDARKKQRTRQYCGTR